MVSLSVSVVTPSYNQSAFIRDTIKSIRRQTYADITHIVVDGDSDDGTIAILEEYDCLQWTSEPDRGQTHAINKGFERADGDVVGWLNSDDLYVYRDTVAHAVEAFETTGADIVFGHAITIGPDNELSRVHYIPEFSRSKLRRHCYIMQPSILFRRRVVEENGLNEDRNYSMDYEFWLDLADQYDWHHLDRVVAADRNHPARKIISDSSASRADTQALRAERGIDRTLSFKLMQLWDSLDLRWRRVRALPLLQSLERAPTDAFAFGLQRPEGAQLLRTQLLGPKKQI